MKPTRRKTKVVDIGGVSLGGENPVRVQSMTTTDPSDLDVTLPQIKALEDAGCEMIRTSVLNQKQGEALGELKKHMNTPLIADIHYHWKLAFTAIEQGVDKIRINPGNIGHDDRFKEIVRAAKANDVPMRIGVNSGSLEAAILEKYSYPTPEGFVESALRYIDMADELGYDKIVISLKSSDIHTAIAAYRLFSQKSNFPLHLGITEAGDPNYGAIKSAAGMSPLLLDGIGDTIRVSLTGDPALEIPVAYDILKTTGVRVLSPEIVSCPTCGRIQIEMEPIVEELNKRLSHVNEPLRVSVLGCIVNGPGEARESDIGLAGGNGQGVIYRKGELVRKVKEEEMIDAVMEEVDAFLKDRKKSGK
ncbi:MAG: flavodoxin-dependent (E)-4-hydroxy-3-methylbut-2-enyl-diphosphate synthase [Planctomycetes bacterium]|nr:flavodoxin-dependent (E)-4-hydroxy-3-methylbut-2-enyl-diphosphate synthase [Planctomycetota bacterium]